MPGFDGTGPHGLGAMTGRAMGTCTDEPTKVQTRRRGANSGAGHRGGRGGRRGSRHRFFSKSRPEALADAPQGPPLSDEELLQLLYGQTEQLSTVLSSIQQRIEELKAKQGA